MSSSAQQINFIKANVIEKIVAAFPGEVIEAYEINSASCLDGFMSALYTIKVLTKNAEGETKERSSIAKFMKGDHKFRLQSRSYVQFQNEIYLYTEILQKFQRLLFESHLTAVSVAQWTARVYFAEFGHLEGISHDAKSIDSVLVLENLNPLGYGMGPRLYLERDQLIACCKMLGEFHALSYAMRIMQPAEFEHTKCSIVPLPFVDPNDPEDKNCTNIYTALYRAAFDRFYAYLDSRTDVEGSFLEKMNALRDKYFRQPTQLLEFFRTHIEESASDQHFGVILHGDFNRNNVLFRKRTGANVDVKMIDFQELRYGTPAIDLSFMLYMNTHPDDRCAHWQHYLQTYYESMSMTLKKVLMPKINSAELAEHMEHYSFESFISHFRRFAFYGAVICMHFLPWMIANEADCAELSHLFETDMRGDRFQELSISIAGDEANSAIMNVVCHAFSEGCLDFI